MKKPFWFLLTHYEIPQLSPHNHSVTTVNYLNENNGKYDSACICDCYNEGQWSYVETIHIHPDYDSDTEDNDIAILKLKTCLCFNNDVQPACLKKSFSNHGSSAMVSGWGSISGNFIKYLI